MRSVQNVLGLIKYNIPSEQILLEIAPPALIQYFHVPSTPYVILNKFGFAVLAQFQHFYFSQHSLHDSE